MKIFNFLFATVLLTTVFLSCEKDPTEPMFIAHEDADGIAFVNSFASNYLLSAETKDNIADRLVWTKPNFGVDANINYEVEGSIRPDSTSFTKIGGTSETNFPVLVSNLILYANELSLDDDPTTVNEDGNQNNTGQVYIRVKAHLGTEEAPTNITYTPTQQLAIEFIEKVDPSVCPSLFALGDALPDYGWSFPGAELVCSDDVLEVKVKLSPAADFPTFKFYQTADDWNSGLGFNYYTDAGYTIDSNLADADDGDDSNFKFTGTDGIYTLRIDNPNKEISLTSSSSLWAVGQAVPGGWGFNDDTVEFVESTPNIWSATIALSSDGDAVFRFFQTFGTWDTNNNYAYYEDQGFTIDDRFEKQDAADNNFLFIGETGTYILTINAIEKTITLTNP